MLRPEHFIPGILVKEDYDRCQNGDCALMDRDIWKGHTYESALALWCIRCKTKYPKAWRKYQDEVGNARHDGRLVEMDKNEGNQRGRDDYEDERRRYPGKDRIAKKLTKPADVAKKMAKDYAKSANAKS